VIALESVVPQILPTGIVGTLLAMVIVGVTSWVRFRNRKVMEWSDLLETAAETTRVKDAEIVELRREIATLRTAERSQYDRAERAERELLRLRGEHD
jgi:alpha-D-ribose 1-methylphosphonate 5-triphosphate diphosphatase PhnM